MKKKEKNISKIVLDNESQRTGTKCLRTQLTCLKSFMTFFAILSMFLCVSCQKGTISLQKTNISKDLGGAVVHLDNSLKSLDGEDVLTAKTEILSAREIVVETQPLISAYQKKAESIEKDRDKLVSEKDGKIQKLLTSLVVLSIVGVGIFGTLFFVQGSKVGLWGSLSCIITLSISLFVQTYLKYLLIGTGVIGLGLVGYIIYETYVRNRALKEVVKGLEEAKMEMVKEVNDKIFGSNQIEGDKGIMGQIQSASTSEIVKKIRHFL